MYDNERKNGKNGRASTPWHASSASPESTGPVNNEMQIVYLRQYYNNTPTKEQKPNALIAHAVYLAIARGAFYIQLTHHDGIADSGGKLRSARSSSLEVEIG